MVQKQPVKGKVSLEDLKGLVEKGEIETVIVGLTDLYGRMVGKRCDASFFLESIAKSGCGVGSYLLATDIEMIPVPGYKFANWDTGYGDMLLQPDLNSLRRASWLSKTAMVLCDAVTEGTKELLPFAPRSILKNQVQAATQLGFKVLAATELEYFLCKDSYEAAKDKQYMDLKPAGWVRENFHILQGTREEFFHGKARQHLVASGVPVEDSKGEWGLGQHELNVKYAEATEMADRHVVYKQCLKELADELGVSVTFMAKPYSDQSGSSSHVHLSLAKDNKNIFCGDKQLGPVRGISDEFRWFLGGWMKHTAELMVFYAPTVNSYKRFASKTAAPTKIAWGRDNRTAPYRIVGSGQGVRIECRLPGADCNPYLGLAAALASGLDGICNKVEPPEAVSGDVYNTEHLQSVPLSLEEATDIFAKSSFVTDMLGKDAQEHYTHFFRTEYEAFYSVVTDWERKRYYEQI